jgi:hypothetical protein
VIQFTEWATSILSRSAEASRRFNPDAKLRVARSGGGIEFSITDAPEPTDQALEHAGFTLFVEEGLEGIVDVVEPHDRLILRPPGSTERSVPHEPRPASSPGPAG